MYYGPVWPYTVFFDRLHDQLLTYTDIVTHLLGGYEIDNEIIVGVEFDMYIFWLDFVIIDIQIEKFELYWSN